MKTTMIWICLLLSLAVFGQEKKTSKGQGTDKHTPANKDYDKPVSKESGKMQIRKSGDNTNGLADTARLLKADEQNVPDRSEDFSASSSGSPSVPSENGGLRPDGTNTAQRASYNMAGSPVPRTRRTVDSGSSNAKKELTKEAQSPKIKSTPKKKRKG